VAPLQARPTAPHHARIGAVGDAGVIMIGTLTKLLFFLAVVGTVGYDWISIATTQVTVMDDAQQAALIAHQVIGERGTPQSAFVAALTFAKKHGDVLTPEDFSIGPNRAVTIVLHREAHTIAAAYVPKIKTYIHATASATVGDEIK
jgi:hypothetical protein